MRLLTATFLFIFWAGICPNVLHSQPAKKLVEVLVAPTDPDWTYEKGDRADFEVRVMKNGQLLPGVTIHYQIGPEQMPAEEENDLLLKEGSEVIKGIKLKNPGFIRCEVSVDYQGITYRGWGTAGYDPEKIEPATEMPEDFDAFWDKAKAELAELPIDARLTLMPDQCTPDINVYHVSLQNIRMPGSWRGVSRFYGVLSVPVKPGKYPAILSVPGAGIRPYGRDDRAADGVIVFKVGIHGLPVNLPGETYESLGTGALSQYWTLNIEDRDKYYYKRVFMGCVRSIDFIFSLSEFDGLNLAVNGGSQGGALSIITTGLDARVKYLAAFYPAMSDMKGYLEGRAGGWPHMFRNYQKEIYPTWEATIPYFDVVNFARRVTVPGWYSWGYNDNVCPPTSMYAAYNVIEAPKEIHLFLETGHWTFPEQREQANQWLMEKLTGKK